MFLEFCEADQQVIVTAQVNHPTAIAYCSSRTITDVACNALQLPSCQPSVGSGAAFRRAHFLQIVDYDYDSYSSSPAIHVLPQRPPIDMRLRHQLC